MVIENQSSSSKRALPEGTVTFLFTDIEGSTKLLHRLGDKYIALLADHHRILREIFARWNGREIDTEGDAFFVSFLKATEALAAVVEAQQALAEYEWPEGVVVRVRMGLHTGEPWTGPGGYVGMDVHRAARIAHVGHGGQVLLSETTAALLRGNLPEGVALRDLGQHRLKDMQFPEHIRQLAISGLPTDFPPLKSLGVVEATEGTDLEPLPQPKFLKEQQAEPERPLFVGRGRELAWLDERLGQALQNKGGVVFVIGEAGLGKSSLLQAFADQATNSVPDLLVTWGTGNAFVGRGDAYLPFRQALGLLGGDVEQAWQGGTVTTEQARRLWATIPLIVQAVAQKGQAIAATLIDGRALLSRARGMSDTGDIWYPRLERLVKWAESHPADLPKDQLHQQCVSVLQGISAEHPLLLLLDDLQWTDGASLNLLFHLGRSLTESRVLIVGAFRPEEVALGRDGERHPLEKVVSELRRLGGDVVLNLEDTSTDENRAIVNGLLDSEPNALERSFREALLAHTSGHPLFTVEMLRHLQARGDLAKDLHGVWSAESEVGWDMLPARVEGVIEERIGRLDDELRELLNVAAVEGENFTAQVVGRVLRVDERRLLQTFSRELAKRHQLIRERSAVEVGRKLLSRYRFSHALFQQYLYNDLTLGERRLLHADIAVVLEDLYAGRTHEVAIQLARHFIESGEENEALPHLLQAGDQARALYAHQEAINFYQQAIHLFSQVEVAPQEQIETYERLAEVFTIIGRFEEAEAALAKTIHLARDPVVQSRIYRKVANTWQLRRQHDKAFEAWQTAEEKLGQISGDWSQAYWQEWLWIQLDKSWVLYWTNQMEDLESLLEKVHPAVEEHGTLSQQGLHYQRLVMLAFRRDRYLLSDETIAYARASFATIQESGRLGQIAFAQFALGLALRDHGWEGDFIEAEYHMKSALAQAQELGDIVLQIRCLIHLTLNYLRQGDLDSVDTFLPQAMTLARKANILEYVAVGEGLESWYAWRNNDFVESQRVGEHALVLARDLPFGWPAKWVVVFPLIGIALMHSENEKAIEYARLMLDPGQMRLPDELTAVLQQAIETWQNNRPDAARANLQQALQLAKTYHYL